MAVMTGPRIRANNVFGTVTDNPLTNVATTLNSAGLANLPAVSSAHAILILDPLRSAGAPEIVVVTAHTASATSATVTRGAYGTSARQHAQGVLWVHAPTIDDVVRVLTADPTDLYEGQLWYRSDTDTFRSHNGTTAEDVLTIGAWTSYTPALTASTTSPTLGTGSSVAGQYTKVGRAVIGRARIKFGTSGVVAGSGAYRISLPVTATSHTGTSRVVGCGLLFDSSGSAVRVPVVWIPDGVTTYVQMNTANDGIGVTDAAPWVWAASDSLEIDFTYEAAA